MLVPNAIKKEARLCRASFFLKVKILLRVIVADALDDFLESRFIVGVFTVLYPLTDHVAENSAEVLVTGVGKEGTGVCEHAHEIAKE